MFVGDKGKILAGFNVQNPKIISGKKMDEPAKQIQITGTRYKKLPMHYPYLLMHAKQVSNTRVVFRKQNI